MILNKVLKDRYLIKEIAGKGAFSTVYCAYDQKFGSDVAIKEFNPQSAARFGDAKEMQKRFEQEARITRRLRHNHIIEIYDIFSANNTYYIVMPYLPETLGNRLEHLTIPKAVWLMMQICDGLAYAHTFYPDKEDSTAVIVHCDIKPNNILLDSDKIKIADFGIAHVPASGNITSSLTTNTFGAGTVLYMPPEQLNGKRDDPRIDVYALGALFYRMLSGGGHYLDFDTSDTTRARANNLSLIFDQTPSDTPLQEKGVPESLVRIVFKALSKKPKTVMLMLVKCSRRSKTIKVHYEGERYLSQLYTCLWKKPRHSTKK